LGAAFRPIGAEPGEGTTLGERGANLSFGELGDWSVVSAGEEGGEAEGEVLEDVLTEVLWWTGGGVGGSSTEIDGGAWTVGVCEGV
jgi:hypothetical protein